MDSFCIALQRTFTCLIYDNMNKIQSFFFFFFFFFLLFLFFTSPCTYFCRVEEQIVITCCGREKSVAGPVCKMSTISYSFLFSQLIIYLLMVTIRSIVAAKFMMRGQQKIRRKKTLQLLSGKILDF